MSGFGLPSGLSATYWRTWAPRNGLSVQESLDIGEEWIGSWDGVGLYEGKNKVSHYQDLTVHLTTHRLLLLPTTAPLELSSPSSSTSRRTPGLQVAMLHVRQTEYYTGFMRSSPKITLSLGRIPSSSATQDGQPHLANTSTNNNGVRETAPEEQQRHEGSGGGWTCPVCGFVNPLDERSQPSAHDKCGLCGITYGKSASMGPNGRVPASGTPSRAGTPVPASPSLSEAAQPAVADSVDGEGRVSCPACTFLNHRSLRNCEMCSTPLPKKQSGNANTSMNGVDGNATVSGTANGSSVGSSEGEGTKLEVVRLSFRKGGEKECYRRLKNVLSDKAWDRETARGELGGSGLRGDDTPRGAGIDGIMQSMRLEAKAQDSHMQDAFKDLEVLMVRAGEMVRLAQSLSSKLPATTSNSEEETLIKTSLVQLGLPTPALTQDMVRDEQVYLEGLAKELGGILTGRPGGMGKGNATTTGLMVGEGGRGVVGLDEVWVIWQRARGVALLSPATLISIIPYLPKYTDPPINLLTLPSSLKVLHTPHYSTQAFLSRILWLLRPTFTAPSSDFSSEESREAVVPMEKSLTAFQVASSEKLAIGMAKELLEAVEMSPPERGSGLAFDGVNGIVRDEQGEGGVRWYRDIISECEVSSIA